MRRGVVVTALTFVSFAFTAGGAGAQARSQRETGPDGFLGVSFVAGHPIGELALFFDHGFGGQIDGAWPVSEDRRVRVRADLGVLVYGHERFGYCYATAFGCRVVGANLTTTNSIVYGGLGPEIAFTIEALEPYVYGTGGLSYFATVSSVDDAWGRDLAQTTNFSDVVAAWKLGGGLRLRVSRGRPVSLDFGIERHWNGIVDFLTEGDIVDNPDGSVTLYANRSIADLTTFRFGVTIGVGGS